MIHDRMTLGYIDALYWTEAGPDSEHSPASKLSKDDEFKAWDACHKLRLACSGEIDLTQYDPEQIGHDLWLTRNGHGTGFWDRVDVYGDNARVLSLMAKMLGAHDVEFIEEVTE